MRYVLPRLTREVAMTEITVSSKGQVVLPKELRDKYGWKAGTKLTVSERSGEVALREASSIEDRFPRITMEEFLANRIKVDKPLPDDREIDEILLAEAVRRFRNATGD
jgi:AbrB family looped-hinge helix DNA binding protein